MSVTTWVLLMAVAAVVVGSLVMAQANPHRTLERVPQQPDRLVLLRQIAPNQGYPVGAVFVDLTLLCVSKDSVRLP